MPFIVNRAPVHPTEPPTQRRDLLDYRFTLSQGDTSLPLNWDGFGYKVVDVEGLDDPVMNAVVDEAPGVWGGFPGGLQVPAREVVFRMRVEGYGGQALAGLRSALRAVTNPVQGPTLITVTDGKGVSHTITGTRFVDAPIAWAGGTWGASGWQMLAVQFRCPNPWWRRAGAVTTAPWTNPSPRGFLGPHFLPLKLSRSTIFGAPATVIVPGEVPALPEWTIDGAADEVTVTHEETGRSWTLDVEGLTRPVTVRSDPDPDVLSVEDGNGANQWTKLAAPYDLWALPVGRQSVSVSATGADSTTRISMVADSLHLSVLG